MINSKHGQQIMKVNLFHLKRNLNQLSKHRSTNSINWPRKAIWLFIELKRLPMYF
jgi:hypothetical protein